jgi:acyl-CoA thioester hydrolase
VSKEPFTLPVRVYYQDTDAGGVVFHARYLHFLERARTEWLREMGFDLRDLLRAGDLSFIVRRADVRYLRPAVLDDRLEVTVAVERLGGAQFSLGQDVLRVGECLVRASINMACVSATSFKPLRLPESLQASLARYAQGTNKS